MNENVINIAGLNRRFKETQALDDVSLTVGKGRVFGLVGENGAGKTTLIQHILGRLKPQSGTVSVFGLDPVVQPESVLAQIGYVSEDRDLPDWMTIEQLIRFLKPFYATWDDTLVAELTTSFELDVKAQIKTLSRGQRARCSLLAALSFRPDLLLLDEPSSGLDVIVRKDILSAVIRTVVNEGRTVVFSSHLLDEVERVADDIVMLHQGKLVLDGSLEDLTSQHHRLTFSLKEPKQAPPEIEGVLHWSGSEREWVAWCNGALESVRSTAEQQGLTLVEQANASLDEIFVAHRHSNSHGVQAGDKS